MNKTDLRHTNNRKANRDLNLELDLWLKFKENNEQPVLIGIAIAKHRTGYSGDKYELFYSPSDYMKDKPFLLRSAKGITDYTVRFETIRQAKYALKKENQGAIWQKKV